jgi:hypothetical protein
MTALKNEIELRDMKMQHQVEMNEMKIRVNMLEMQKELVDKISKCKNNQTLYNNHTQLYRNLQEEPIVPRTPATIPAGYTYNNRDAIYQHNRNIVENKHGYVHPDLTLSREQPVLGRHQQVQSLPRHTDVPYHHSSADTGRQHNQTHQYPVNSTQQPVLLLKQPVHNITRHVSQYYHSPAVEKCKYI